MSVAVITDIHHGLDSIYVRGGAAWELFRAALKEIGAQEPDLLIDLGDRINQKEPAEAERAMAEVADGFQGVSLPKVHLQGNDDSLPRSYQEALFGVSLGNRSLELGGWQLVFLDTFDGTVEGVVTAKTLGWLEGTLAATPRPAVVFSHQPLDGQPLPGNVFFGGEYFYQAHPKGHEAVRGILERSGKVRLAVSGHAHWQHRVRVAGISYLTLDALVPLAGEKHGRVSYARLELGDDALRLETFGRDPRRFELDVRS